MLTPLNDSIVLENLLLLAQGEVQRELTPMQSIISNPFLPLVGFVLIYYYTFLQPERKKKREDTLMKSQMKKNDRIITVGGIHGTLVSVPADSDVVTIRLDESGATKIKINRSAVVTVINEKSSGGEN